MPRRVQRKRPRLPLQLHFGQLVQHLVALSSIAVMTARHKVLPRRKPRRATAESHGPASTLPQSVPHCSTGTSSCPATEYSSCSAPASGAESVCTPAAGSRSASPPASEPRAASRLALLRARHSLQHQNQRTPRPANVDRLIRRIQHQHRSLHRRLPKHTNSHIPLRDYAARPHAPHAAFPLNPCFRIFPDCISPNLRFPLR